MSLVQTLQSPTARLSEVTAAVLSYAHRRGNRKLADLCANELAGYGEDCRADDMPPYRLIPVYATKGQLNLQYIGWGGNVTRVFEHMRQNLKVFVPQKLAVPFPLAEIEENASQEGPNQVFTHQVRIGQMNPTARNPDQPVFLYGSGDAFSQVLSGIRNELCRRLIGLLPGRSAPAKGRRRKASGRRRG